MNVRRKGKEAMPEIFPRKSKDKRSMIRLSREKKLKSMYRKLIRKSYTTRDLAKHFNVCRSRIIEDMKVLTARLPVELITKKLSDRQKSYKLRRANGK